jgi:hypothetical protein
MAMQKKEKILGGAVGATRAAGGGALEPGAALATLGLFLLLGGRPGRRLTREADDDPATAGVVLFFASTRAAPTSRRHWRSKVQTRTICVSHVDEEEG